MAQDGVEVITSRLYVNQQNIEVSDGVGNTFTVAGDTGNTYAAGDVTMASLNVDSTSFFSGLVTASNGVIVQGADLAINAQSMRVTSDGTTNEFTISSTGDTVTDGTLAVELAADMGGVEVTTADMHVSANDLILTSDGLTQTFSADSATGNVAVGGTLTHSSTITSSADVQGNEMRPTNGLIVTNEAFHMSAVGLSVTSDGASEVFSTASATGNTAIAGTITVLGATTFNNGIDAASTHIDSQNFKVTSNGVLSKASVEASSGNVILAGSLGVTSTPLPLGISVQICLQPQTVHW